MLNSTDGTWRQSPAWFDTKQTYRICSSFKCTTKTQRGSREPESFVECLSIGPTECRREFQQVAPGLSCQGGSCIDQEAADALPARIIAHDQCRDPGDWLAVVEHEGPMHGDQPDDSVVFGCKQDWIGRLFREQGQTCPHVLNAEGVAKLAQQFLYKQAVAQISRPDVDQRCSLNALPGRGRQPSDHVAGVPIWREDRIEHMRHPAIVHNQRASLQQRHSVNLEGWQAQGMCKLKVAV